MTAAATPRLAGNLSRPPSGHVLMFRLPILQSSHRYKDERTGYLIKDRLSFMRFLRLSLAQSVPDANSIWNSWGADAGDRGFVQRFDAALTKPAFSRWADRSSTAVPGPCARRSIASKISAENASGKLSSSAQSAGRVPS